VTDNNRLYAPCPGGISKGTWQQVATLPTTPPMKPVDGIPNNSSEHSEMCFVRDVGVTILYDNIRSEIAQAAKSGKILMIMSIGPKIMKEIKTLMVMLSEKGMQELKPVVHYIPFKTVHHETSNYDT